MTLAVAFASAGPCGTFVRSQTSAQRARKIAAAGGPIHHSSPAPDWRGYRPIIRRSIPHPRLQGAGHAFDGKTHNADREDFANAPASGDGDTRFDRNMFDRRGVTMPTAQASTRRRPCSSHSLPVVRHHAAAQSGL